HLFDPNHPENGHQLLFSYYDDGNLLRITEAGGFNADSTTLASRSWIFTYTTSDGSGRPSPTPPTALTPTPRPPTSRPRSSASGTPTATRPSSRITVPPAASTAGSWPRCRTGRATSPASATTTSTR